MSLTNKNQYNYTINSVSLQDSQLDLDNIYESRSTCSGQISVGPMIRIREQFMSVTVGTLYVNGVAVA